MYSVQYNACIAQYTYLHPLLYPLNRDWEIEISIKTVIII